MENKLYLRTLYPKLVNREISTTELSWLIAYFDTDQLGDLRQMLREELNLNDEEIIILATQEEISAGRRIYNFLEQEIVKETAHQPMVRKIWPRIAAAAAIVMVMLGTILFYYSAQNAGKYQTVAVPPGKIGATLILANGKQIKLTDAINGEIATEEGISVTKTADGQLVYAIKETTGNPDKINTLVTAKGETYVLILPDKSKVWLNAASRLTYAAVLNSHGVRKVKLEGEAYFEISKDKAHPFIVETGKQQTEVLGTHFNINSYADEQNVKTTLLEGSVRVSLRNAPRNDAGGAEVMILKPGQQATLNPEGTITVAQIAVEDAIAWKNGKFVFENESIESIMRRLGRWYDVDVVYENEAVKELPFTGSISRYDNISKILDKITYTQNIHFKIEGRRITVMK